MQIFPAKFHYYYFQYSIAWEAEMSRIWRCIKSNFTVKLFPQITLIGYSFNKYLVWIYVYFTYAVIVYPMHEQIF